MRVAILTELFLPSIGGQEIRFAEVSEALSRRGHSVDIFCIQSDPLSLPREALGNITIHRHPNAPNYQGPAIKWFRRQPTVMLRYALWCRRIDPEAFDLFIFNEWPLVHILLARRDIRSNGVIDWCEFRNGLLFGLCQRYFPRMVAGNIANSACLKNRLEALSGRSFEVLPSGIVRHRYRYNLSQRRSGILYLGRITEHKNLGLLLSSYESLRAKGYEGPLRIAGTGPALPRLRASRIAGKIELLGGVDESRKVELLSNSEVLVLTSRREGFPRVVSEAMASGLPVVTANYPENGTVQVVKEYGIGETAQPTADAISDGILRVLSKWDSYSMACISGSKSLDWEMLVDRFLQIAAQVVRTP